MSAPPPPRQGPAGRAYFPALDGVRALAFLLVFGAHYIELPWGWGGVDVFFVLSGFLITGILFDTRDQPHRARNFYVRRTLRIFPLYYGVLALVAASYPIFHWRMTWGWLAWPAYVGNFTRGLHPFTKDSAGELLAHFQPLSADGRVRLPLGHFWSLCVEEQFYLIWPWVVFSVRSRRKLLLTCVAAVIVCPCMRATGSHLLPSFMLDQGVLSCWTPFRVDALLLGGLVALIERGKGRTALFWVANIGFWIMSLVAVCWMLQSRHAHRDYASPPWEFTWGLLFVDVLSACLIVSAIHPSTWIFKLFNLPPLRWLGRISYGAYVFHDIFHSQISLFVDKHHIHHGERATCTIAMGLTLLLAWMSFRWFESPFIRLKNRWTT